MELTPNAKAHSGRNLRQFNAGISG